MLFLRLALIVQFVVLGVVLALVWTSRDLLPFPAAAALAALLATTLLILLWAIVATWEGLATATEREASPEAYFGDSERHWR